MTGLDAWWRDVLERGYVLASKYGHETHLMEWIDPLSNDLAFEAFVRWQQANGAPSHIAREEMGKYLSRLYGEPRKIPNMIRGENKNEIIKTSGDKRRRGRYVGTLEDARAKWTAQTGVSFDNDAE